MFFSDSNPPLQQYIPHWACTFSSLFFVFKQQPKIPSMSCLPLGARWYKVAKKHFFKAPSQCLKVSCIWFLFIDSLTLMTIGTVLLIPEDDSLRNSLEAIHTDLFLMSWQKRKLHSDPVPLSDGVSWVSGSEFSPSSIIVGTSETSDIAAFVVTFLSGKWLAALYDRKKEEGTIELMLLTRKCSSPTLDLVIIEGTFSI